MSGKGAGGRSAAAFGGRHVQGAGGGRPPNAAEISAGGWKSVRTKGTEVSPAFGRRYSGGGGTRVNILDVRSPTRHSAAPPRPGCGARHAGALSARGAPPDDWDGQLARRGIVDPRDRRGPARDRRRARRIQPRPRPGPPPLLPNDFEKSTPSIDFPAPAVSAGRDTRQRWRGTAAGGQNKFMLDAADEASRPHAGFDFNMLCCADATVRPPHPPPYLHSARALPWRWLRAGGAAGSHAPRSEGRGATTRRSCPQNHATSTSSARRALHGTSGRARPPRPVPRPDDRSAFCAQNQVIASGAEPQSDMPAGKPARPTDAGERGWWLPPPPPPPPVLIGPSSPPPPFLPGGGEGGAGSP